jgi:hypothetical protein
MGFNFYLIIGLHILFYYSFDVTQRLNVGYDLFRFSMEVNYEKSDIIIVGINLIPLLLFLAFNIKLNSFDRNLENELFNNLSN